MYITKLVFYTVVLCVSELCKLKTALFCTAGGDKYPLIHVHVIIIIIFTDTAFSTICEDNLQRFTNKCGMMIYTFKYSMFTRQCGWKSVFGVF